MQKQKMTFKDLKKVVVKNDTNLPNTFGKEGEDHINISINSEFKLGKVFSPEYAKTFYYPNIGRFASVSSLWFWVRSEDFDDNLRNLNGVKLRDYIAENNSYGGYIPNFKAIIGYATWLKIKKYPQLLKQLKELDTNKIKFISYRTIRNSGLRLSSKYSDLLIAIANEITKAVKEEREPNFDFLCDNKDKMGLFYLEGVLSKILPEEKIEELKNAGSTTHDEEESEVEVEETFSEIEEVEEPLKAN